MRGSEFAIVAVLVVAAGGAAFVVGRTTATSDAPDVVPRTSPPVKFAEPPPTAPVPASESIPTPPSPASPLPKGTKTAAEWLKTLVADAPDARLADADNRAAKIRVDAQRTSDTAEWSAARQIADEIAKERAFLADKERGGTMALLHALKGSGAHPFDLVGSPDRFAALFERKTAGPQVDGLGLRDNTAIADGATITFPAGIHSWGVSQLGRGKRPFPKDLLVVGAGMDATILKIDEFNADTEVASLTFRDLTIDCSSNYMTDLRSENPITLRLERCRVMGFDMAAGSSVMLSARGAAAFYATDSRIEAGFTRPNAIGSGNVFRVDGGFLVRMERCALIGPFSSVFHAGDDATYDFVDTTFTNIGRRFNDSFATPPAGVRFENCTISDVDAATTAAARIAFLAKVATASGTPSNLFVMLATYNQSLAPLAADRAAFAKVFEPVANGPTVDGVSQTLAGAAPEAATVVFPAGAFEWSANQRLPGFTGELTILGQGMDTTLVKLQDRLKCGRLVLRDLTLDVGHGSLPEENSRVSMIRIERCRLVGFDTGAGGSTLFGSGGPTMVYAEDSQFTVGYGRSPPGGSLFRGGNIGARFERCTLRIPQGTICDPRNGECAFFFVGCRLMDVSPTSKDMFDKPPAGLTLTSCSIEYATATEKPDRDGRLSLGDINAAWGDKRR